MNNIISSIKMAFSALMAQRTRSILTILGISIGIAIVITIMAAGRGLDKFVLGELDAFSPDALSIETKIPSVGKNSTDNSAGQSTGVTITSLKDKDIEDIKKQPNIAAAYGWVIGQGVVSYGGLDKTLTLMGEGYTLPDVEKFTLSSGRMFTREEEYGLQQVAVLGDKVKNDLFGQNEAVGKNIYIKGKPFRVVGVSAKRGASFYMDMDNLIIIPTKTMQKRVLGIDYVRSIMARMKDGTKVDATVADINAILRENHNITDPSKDDFAVSSMAEARKTLGSVVQGVTFLLVALVCISLIVGGVGIMNIMYVSVTERTFEIGLRKAIGAKNKDILLQFLSEAVLLTFLGGVFGIIFGVLIALLIYFVAIANNFKWVFSIPISSIILSLGFSTFIGIVFGLYPAKRAANMDPIEALRKE
ncbi:MAG: ABC transporter permease [Candidatus Magasanikbacteria bacterium]|nr:ABC transporter permease [Candidatus Magasanikbacteria bacterium]